MLKGFLLGILIYSLIQTVFCLYKNNSGYFIIQGIDFILAGPVSWLLIMILWVLSPLYPYFKKFLKKREQKPLSQKEIERTVRKIVSIYRKHNKTTNYFDFTAHSHRSEYDSWECIIEGWEMLMERNYKFERVNNKFQKIMWNQKEEGIKELEKYFVPISEEELDSLDLYKPPKDDLKIYKIKENPQMDN